MEAVNKLADRFEQGLKLVMEAMKAEYIAQGHNASGKTLESFEVVVRREFSDLIGEILVNETWIFQDKGTRPHRPPFQAIFDWSRHVLKGASEKERRSFSWAVINKIGQEGTPTRGSYSFSDNGRRKEFSKVAIDATNEEFEQTLDFILFIIQLGDETFTKAA